MDPFNPKVSIVMPVFNGGRYFELALQSALAQTYERLEVVVVDDGSTDGGETEAIGRRYAALHPERVRYIRQENTGAGGALNTGVRAMTGDVFCWLSHDDLHLPEKTAVQVDFWRGLRREDAMLVSDYDLIDPEGELIAPVRFNHRQFAASPLLPLYRGAVNGCTVFIPTHLLRELDGPFDTSRRYTQDYWLWRALLRRTEFFHVPESLVRYRVHPSQDSQRPAAIAEGEALWRSMIEEPSETGRVQLYGSSWRFFEETRKVLASTPYQTVIDELTRRRDALPEAAKVTVVIPFKNEIALVRRAAASVLAQTHANLELLLIDDGSTEPLDELLDAIGHEARVRLHRQPNAGPGAARNLGLTYASGDYIAFLDADDVWLPHKLEVQLEAMMRAGAVFSHSSYLVSFPEVRTDFGLLRAGRFSGKMYPRIIEICPVATPTVMIHRSILAAGWRFPEGVQLGEDILGWIELAQRHDLLGVDTPLAVIEWSSATAAINLDKARLGISNLIAAVERDPVHGRWTPEIQALRKALALVDAREAALARKGDGSGLDHALIDHVFRGANLEAARLEVLEAAARQLELGRPEPAKALLALARTLRGDEVEPAVNAA